MKRLLTLAIFSLLIGSSYGNLSASEKMVEGDAEAAKHGDEAAYHQVIEEETSPDFVFRQYDLAVLSHYSYMVASGGEAMIIDPSRDVDRYIQDANKLGFEITRVYLTHSHADFVAGHIELAQKTGAKIFINRGSGAGYPHTPVTDNDEIRFGKVRTVVRLTPGHTPDGTCLFLHYPDTAKDPKLVFTGDTLFIGGVGRPDLMGGTISAAELATMGYNTWKNVLSKVPHETKIYPAHGAGSLCGANLSDKPVSTFGEQWKENPYFQYKDLATYVMSILDGLPEAPQYFGHNAKMNKLGPALVEASEKMPRALTSQEVEKMAHGGAWLLDVREASLFSAGHVPGSINIPIRGRFETWVGTMIPWGAPFVIVGSEEETLEAKFRLTRIGYDQPAGYLKGGVRAWENDTRPVKTVMMVKARDLHMQIQQGSAPVLVDVRLPKEWMGLRIADKMLNMPINALRLEATRLDPAMPVMTICNSAYRSSMGASVLLKAGFKDVRNLEGGSQAWIEAGLPTYSSVKAEGKEGGVPSTYVDLPERMSVQDLAQRLLDLPGSLEIVDIRPRWQFDEYHIPGSSLAAVSAVLHNPALLVGKSPLVIVCRDGSLSAAVAGAIFSKSERPIRYLVGGVSQYWDEMMPPPGIVNETGMGTGPRSLPDPPVKTSPPPLEKKSAPEPPKPVKKRANAGC
jgi:rhodanese-related sulfurtransferase/glyoxylase-like metal-dependent hydrolase (beta-lactamase superfamily II)